jgi:hypothetical protein
MTAFVTDPIARINMDDAGRVKMRCERSPPELIAAAFVLRRRSTGSPHQAVAAISVLESIRRIPRLMDETHEDVIRHRLATGIIGTTPVDVHDCIMRHVRLKEAAIVLLTSCFCNGKSMPLVSE